MRVQDIMTEEPLRARPDMTAGEAMTLLALGVMRHLPVVDGRRLVGMVSERDLLRLYASSESKDAARDTRLDAIMSTDVVTVSSDDDVGVVIDRLLANGIGALPVVDGDGHVVGIVSYVDVLAAQRPV